MLGEQGRVLGEGKMPDARHHGEARAGDFRRRGRGMLGGAGIIVLPGQHHQRAAAGVDPPHPLARIPLARVEAEALCPKSCKAVKLAPAIDSSSHA